MNNIKSFNSFNNDNNQTELVKEHGETQNYMFFGNLQTIKRLVDEMLKMDESKVDQILKEIQPEDPNDYCSPLIK
jgi:hypothetical protein